MTRRKKPDEVHLPEYVPEDEFPEGDRPRWIAEAVGAMAWNADRRDRIPQRRRRSRPRSC